MKFLAVSDLHGWLPEIREEFDLLMIPGDVCPDMYGVEYSQIDWFSGVFIPWINNLPFKHAWSKVIFVPGNHDKCFDGIVSKVKTFEDSYGDAIDNLVQKNAALAGKLNEVFAA